MTGTTTATTITTATAKRIIHIPAVITVQIDSREKYPIPFPANIRIEDPAYYPPRKKIIKVRTETTKLDAGDYRLKEFPDCCVIERKGSQLEIFKNLFNPYDQIRMAKALRRLSSVEYPYLLIEVSPAAMMRAPLAPPRFNPEVLVCRLSTIIAKYGLRTLWVSKSSSSTSRRALGITLTHLMLAHALGEALDVPLSSEMDFEMEVVPDGGESSDD